MKNIERRRLTHYSLVLFVPLFVRFLLVQLFSWVQNCAQYILFACTMVTCVMLPLAATSQLVVSSLCLVLGELLPRSVVVTWVRAVLMIGEGEPGHDIGCRLSLAISLNISFHSNFCLTGGRILATMGWKIRTGCPSDWKGCTAMTSTATYHSINFHLSPLLASIGEVS